VTDKSKHIVKVTLDEKSIVRRNADVEHERAVAIFDLLEHNHFIPSQDVVEGNSGPYSLHLRIEEDRLILDIRTEDDAPLGIVALNLKIFSRIVKDYFLVCESYFDAIKTSTPARIEAIDMGRRGLHDEGAEILSDRLKGQIDIDTNTARRLFTLVCVLHIRA